MRYLLALALLAYAIPRASAGIIADHIPNGFDSRYDIYSSGYGTPAPVRNTAANFIGLPYDFSGVGYSQNSVQLSVSMISPRYFVGAWHVTTSGFNFNPGQTVTFINRPPAGSPTLRTFTVGSINRLQNPDSTMSDVLIGRLTTAIQPSDFMTTYAIPFSPVETTYLNQPLLNYGQNTAYGAGNLVHVGRNNIDQIATVQFAPPDPSPTRGFTYNYIPANPGEFEVIPLDSGSPSFIPVSGNLTIVGAHFGFDPATNTSIDSFLPAYITQINAILAADGESVTLVPIVVPEPSSILLVGVAGAAFCWRRATRRRVV